MKKLKIQPTSANEKDGDTKNDQDDQSGDIQLSIASTASTTISMEEDEDGDSEVDERQDRAGKDSENKNCANNLTDSESSNNSPNEEDEKPCESFKKT